MRLKGITTAVDYAYLNVMDINDPDNRTILSMKEHTQSLKSIWSKKSIIQQYIVSSPHLPSSKRHSLLSCLTSPILGTSYSKSRSGFALYTNCKKWLNWVLGIWSKWAQGVNKGEYSWTLLQEIQRTRIRRKR